MRSTGPIRVAEQFFADLGAENFQAAYELTSKDFRAHVTQENFAARLGPAFKSYDRTLWSLRRTDGITAKLQGRALRKDGSILPFTLTLLREEGRVWRIASVLSLTLPEEDKPSPPSEAEAQSLADDTLNEFRLAILHKDFTSFYTRASDLLKADTKAETILSGYRKLIDAKLGLWDARGPLPVLSQPPRLNELGFLEVRGTQILPKGKIEFSFTYTLEQGTWKLRGFEI